MVQKVIAIAKDAEARRALGRRCTAASQVLAKIGELLEQS